MSSALAAGVAKKRKKSDTKPQAQINKCQNEKRRREQENIYIEELAELISSKFADMSSISVKPDKCAILQETVNQIRSIRQRESSSGAAQSSDPVQQGEVSSSRPTILSNEIFGPLLLEAIEGFFFIVNGEGKVEYVTENVSTYIKFSREEVLGKSIYNFIHHGDHARFSPNPMAISVAWNNEPSKSRSFSCRLLVKPDDQDDSFEEKQQRVIQYETMHISSTQLKQSSEEDSSDSSPWLLFLASRITHRDKAVCAAAIEQFTTKLDTNGKIIGVDVSGISMQYSPYLNKDLVGGVLQDLCAPHEVHKLTQHLRDTLSAGQATSGIYRLRVGSDKFVQVQTKSKLFKPNPHSTTDTDFVMATHSIISNENDCTGPSDPGGGGGGGGGGGSVGGPLMTSVVNGTTTRNGAPAITETSNASSNLPNMSTNSSFGFTLDNESMFPFDFPSTTWDSPILDNSNWQSDPRPDSRQSVSTPVSTPGRPPSAPIYSPATTQSPLVNPSTPYSNFNYSPITGDGNFLAGDDKPDTKVNAVLDEMTDSSARLRTLLTKPSAASAENGGDSENRNKNTILKGLLNQPDEDESRTAAGDTRTSPRAAGAARSAGMPGTSELPKSAAAGGMLLQLLNEKSDDDDVEAKAGLKKGSELLNVLMKDEEERKTQNQNDALLQSLGFNSSPSPPNGDPGRARKRPSDDTDDNPLKRSSDGSQVSSSGTGGSKLCEKNKMLAQLLAITPSNHQTIPPVPASVISATPQEKLPRITDPGLSKNPRGQNHLNLLNNNRRLPGRPPATNYLNQMLSSESGLQRNRNYQNAVDSQSFSSPASSSTDWAEQSSDPLLSIILDQVIDIVPDAIMTNANDIQTLLDAMSPQNNANSYSQTEAMSEKMAINIIQKSLMQCESAVKSPSSPKISLPGSSPAYSTNTMSQSNQGGFPPPPNYGHLGNMHSPQVRAGAPQYPITSQQMLQQQQQQHKTIMQQNERRRLLQRQRLQQVVIPSNATADINQGLDNIENLINNTVAPNVSLQRSASVPESQLSPNYQNQRINSQQQPYSPHSQLTSPIGGGQTAGAYQQAGARLSPHPPFNQQLSPRQAYPQTTAQNNNWQQNTGRLSVQQQQNPMLNAQLTGNYVPGPNGRGFPSRGGQQQQQQQQQQQGSRAIGSPGAAATRQSPFQASESFPPPASPNSPYSQNQYLRLHQRSTSSAPTATTQLPGGLGSPRPYAPAREHPPHSSYPNIPTNHPHHPMMYQQESPGQYLPYDQTGLQLSYNGAPPDRAGRAPPHLQAGVSGGSGPASEYVRQELRAVVGARTGQQIPAGNATRPQQQQQQQQQQILSHNVNSSDLEALGLSFETPGASESPKIWAAMGSEMGSMSPPQAATSRNSMEEGRQGDHKSSLLQKLLSE